MELTATQKPLSSSNKISTCKKTIPHKLKKQNVILHQPKLYIYIYIYIYIHLSVDKEYKCQILSLIYPYTSPALLKLTATVSVAQSVERWSRDPGWWSRDPGWWVRFPDGGLGVAFYITQQTISPINTVNPVNISFRIHIYKT